MKGVIPALILSPTGERGMCLLGSSSDLGNGGWGWAGARGSLWPEAPIPPHPYGAQQAASCTPFRPAEVLLPGNSQRGLSPPSPTLSLQHRFWLRAPVPTLGEGP